LTWRQGRLVDRVHPSSEITTRRKQAQQLCRGRDRCGGGRDRYALPKGKTKGTRLAWDRPGLQSMTLLKGGNEKSRGGGGVGGGGGGGGGGEKQSPTLLLWGKKEGKRSPKPAKKWGRSIVQKKHGEESMDPSLKYWRGWRKKKGTGGGVSGFRNYQGDAMDARLHSSTCT